MKITTIFIIMLIGWIATLAAISHRAGTRAERVDDSKINFTPATTVVVETAVDVTGVWSSDTTIVMFLSDGTMRSLGDVGDTFQYRVSGKIVSIYSDRRDKWIPSFYVEAGGKMTCVLPSFGRRFVKAK
jgi:hypothetical protein